MMQVDTLVQFPFADLPTEINFLILTYAARPTFSQPGPRWYGKSYYSSALALCCVSRTVRRIILPELLHTVFLVKASNVLAFMHALNMQSAYAQQKNHLHIDYAAYVHRIWISVDFGSSFRVPLSDNIDFSLLAPVLLAAQSLALHFESLPLLNGCLEYAWNSHADLNIDQEDPPNLPWSTKTLTLLEESSPTELPRLYPLTNTAQERAFFASISYLITLPLTLSNAYRRSQLDSYQNLYSIPPKWTESFSRASLKSLRAVSMAMPYLAVYGPFDELAPLRREDAAVDFMTFSDHEDLLSGNWAQKVLGLSDTRREMIPSVEVGGGIVSSSDPSLIVFEVFLDWEQAWARGKCDCTL